MLNTSSLITSVANFRFARLVTWKALAIVLLVANLKSVPFVWHLRLLYRLATYWTRPKKQIAALEKHANKGSPHPVFETVTIKCRSPLYEIDYNLHKSNSTYFSDLDESRTALVTMLLSPNSPHGIAKLNEEGHKGPLGVILGSVHTTFHREIKPYERYDLRSRVLTWDRKWLVIVSFFVRPASRGKDEVLLASSLSKYVVKKGRFTVSPQRCLRTAGWLPEIPEGCGSGAGETREDSGESDTLQSPAEVIGDETATSTSESAGDTITNGNAAPIPKVVTEASAVVDKLEYAAEIVNGEPASPEIQAKEKAKTWDWHRIEMERVRGLRIASKWLSLDRDLIEEFAHGL